MVNSTVELSGLRVRRSGHEVLRGITANVGAGSITGLLGPSGCGKTTMLRAIIGTQRISGGTVQVLGRPAGSPALRRSVGYASQQASVYDDLTVGENVAYFATAVRAPTGDADRVLEQVELTSFRHRVTGQLSGGERSRVSLAVAMLGTPRLLVLDEPTVGLDPVLREQLWQLFGRLAADGVALLVSSHVMDEANRCHDLMLMRAGQLIAQQSPAELLRRTNTDSLEAAFLALVRHDEAA